jgi:starch synthase
MRLLYLTFGAHSGIVHSHARALGEIGTATEVVNIAAGFNYRLPGRRIPSPYPVNLANSLVAMTRYGRDWRYYFDRTDLAFHWMSLRSRRLWRQVSGNFDAVLQSGVLFHAAPPRTPSRLPYFLHIDHTYSISRDSTPVKGLRVENPASATWERMEAATYRDADGIFTMSEFVKRALEKDYGVPGEKITVVGGGPNFPALPLSNGGTGAGPTILFVGIDFVRKGGLVLLDAFRIVRDQIPEAELLVVGPPDIPAQPGVTLLGTLPPDQMPSLYARSRVFAMPSWREPFGIAFLEAMAHGLPCVGTRVEAIPEIVDDRKTGLLVEPGAVEELAACLVQLLREQTFAEQLGAAGRRKVEQRFNWERTARIMADKMRGHAGARDTMVPA